jgi:uncharacterized delta-60 repeat protein
MDMKESLKLSIIRFPLNKESAMNRAFRLIFTPRQICKTIAVAAFILLNIIFLSAESVNAQLDPTFGTNGLATAETGISDEPLASFVLPDGKILIVSRNDCCSTPNKMLFIRYNSDGTPDSTYGTNGIIEVAVPYSPANSGEINGAARQPDGKIILVGEENRQRAIIARYNENGTLDSGFAVGGVHRPNMALNGDERLYTALVQPDGKILVAGGAEVSSGVYPNLALLRYNANGSLDTTFDNDGFIVHTNIEFPSLVGAEYLYLQSNGKIIVGNFREENNVYPFEDKGAIRRYNADGSVDNSFTVRFYYDFRELGSVAIQPDDKILAANYVNKTETLERAHRDAAVTRFNPDGSFDTSFGVGGQSSFDITNYQDDTPNGLKVMPDGQILVAVNTHLAPNRTVYSDQWLALARLSPSGAVNGKFLVARPNHGTRSFISVQPDGKILTVYSAYTSPTQNVLYKVRLARAVGVPLQTYKIRGTPFDFNRGTVTGNGIASIIYYGPTTNVWHFYISNSYGFGLSGDIPVAADYIGSFYAEFAQFRPSTGVWYIAKSYSNAATNFLAIQWGAAGDIPVPADYNGDGKYDVAVFRPSDGTWYIYYIENGSYTIQRWGLNGDKPAPGDYDGDSIYDIAVYRPSEGNWYIQRSSDGGYTILHFGLDGDVPVQEDYDGDGKTDIAVYRPSNGVWYRIDSSDGTFRAYQWGLPGDIPIPGDYNGDLKINIAVWRPSNGGWYIYHPEINQMTQYNWGAVGDVIPQAKY